MNSVRAQISRWRDEADVMHRNGDLRGAQMCRLHADDMEAALREADEQLLNLQQAAAHSGYSARQLSRLIQQGELANRGRPNAPRVRVGDLPRKPARLPNRRPKHQVECSTKEQIVQSIVNRQG